MVAQISIITVLHVSHHLLNPEDGAFREFKDEDIHSKKRRFNKPKPDMIVIRYSAQQKHAHLMGIHTATRTQVQNSRIQKHTMEWFDFYTKLGFICRFTTVYKIFRPFTFFFCCSLELQDFSRPLLCFIFSLRWKHRVPISTWTTLMMEWIEYHCRGPQVFTSCSSLVFSSQLCGTKALLREDREADLSLTSDLWPLRGRTDAPTGKQTD